MADMDSTLGDVGDLAMPHHLSMADQAASVLRRRIADGLLEPGRQLREEQLTATFKISRNTLREAFLILIHEGLIVREPFRGVFVRVVTAADVSDIFRTRQMLEPMGVDPLTKDPVASAKLLKIVAAAYRAAEAEDWREVGTANLDLHRALVEPCRSVRLDRLFAQLFAELRLAFLLSADARAFLLSADARTMHEPYLAWNKSIAELIAEGKAAAAKKELSRYLDHAERQVIAAVAR
jgi:DNA-binding GntR family transcriptional regulator